MLHIYQMNQATLLAAVENDPAIAADLNQIPTLFAGHGGVCYMFSFAWLYLCTQQSGKNPDDVLKDALAEPGGVFFKQVMNNYRKFWFSQTPIQSGITAEDQSKLTAQIVATMDAFYTPLATGGTRTINRMVWGTTIANIQGQLAAAPMGIAGEVGILLTMYFGPGQGAHTVAIRFDAVGGHTNTYLFDPNEGIFSGGSVDEYLTHLDGRYGMPGRPASYYVLSQIM